jgi:hypothetical protein
MRIRLLGKVLTIVLLAGAPSAAPLPTRAAAVSAATESASASISYLGYSFTVPASWPVIRLAAGSATCVRLDKHAVYLGTPPAVQDCPATILGRTEALIIQSGTTAHGPVTAQTTEDQTSHEIDTYAPGIAVTSTYSSRPDQIRTILASAGLPLAVSDTARGNLAPGLQAAPANVALPTGATRFTGPAFDPCSAPSPSTMDAWKTGSPYGAIGIYLGGANMGCSQPNLTPGWVSTEASAGWHFFLLYVGPQAPGSSCTSCSTITSAASQGASAAQDAAAHAANLGFGTGTPIIYDMEDYPPSGTATVLAFISSWTNELRALGYASGEYSSLSSGVSDLIDNAPGPTTPDIVDFAAWNGAATTGDPSIPDANWANHQRIHQYSGGVDQTFGGYTINVDQDYLDVQGSFNTPVGGTLGDVTGDGRSDLLATAPNGDLLVYPNTGATGMNTFGRPTQVGSGWNGYMIAAVTNPYASGRAGIVAVAPNGTLFYYPNTGATGMNTFGQAIQIGSGWNGYTIVGPADLYNVGRPGLLAVAPDGTLFYYPNTGGSATGTFGSPTQVGSGWNGWTVDVADINRDGKPDLLAVNSAGMLYMYPNTGRTATGTFGSPTQVGSGWNGWQAIDVGVLSGTPGAEILGIDSTGTLYEFPNTSVGGSAAFGRSAQVGSGWTGYAVK